MRPDFLILVFRLMSGRNGMMPVQYVICLPEMHFLTNPIIFRLVCVNFIGEKYYSGYLLEIGPRAFNGMNSVTPNIELYNN